MFARTSNVRTDDIKEHNIMKSIIIPASIILALIAFLVIVDRKEFKRHNDIQTVQRENLTVNRNLSLPIPKAGLVTEARSPVKAKLVAGLPLKETSVETKMVVDSKSVVDAKQADVNKSSPVALPVISPEEAMKANEEAKKIQRTNEMLAETNETVSFAETTVEDKPAPAAIPVLTREEAIKANKEAIRFQRNAATAKAIRAFCQKIGINKKAESIIITTIGLAHMIGAKVTAEGVETEEQLKVLRNYDCDYIQGYYFYKPMPENEFEKILDK